MVVKKKVKIIIAVIVFTLTLSVGKVFASSDPGEQLKLWYVHTFKQTISGVAGNVEGHRQAELDKLVLEKEKLLESVNAQIAKTATEVSKSASETISLHTEGQIEQLTETRDMIINYNIEIDFQTYIDQKIEQIEDELFNYLVQIINEKD
ncbi:hypothetical protein DS745_05620 [Anaerobacillus alkaliphilus]|uniref:Uncharacterized protein n=1 Tax=Anaerobacillus alkaliphilus TaxID=1548597 RepID=A0A4V1LGQ9_9BACI|nr:hypothetical protein [Anaerobacillus alkaliphilus]RXJ02788.1 hypothetical protein DS745_05620 [Anaerobacillus alkaliphilus]